ncbi:MAG: NAD(P)/FAD-dependent oxidoreductase [Promethearchaeota archaeon]|nr:MAG: NAD(P)/FAD-dependent oxidoreductase [Candidatus Lokiarchaeota archaeon]
MEKIIEKFDVCIVGGSLAGNYLSYLLSNSKLNIVVIEEHKEIGLPFQCAGIISKKLSNLIELPEKIVLNRVKIAKIVSPSGKFIKLSGDEEPYVIDRIALDRLFFDKCKNFDNITYLLGEKFKSFKYFKGNHQKLVLIHTNKRKIKAKMLIGCDGPLSSVSKILGRKQKVIYASQIRVRANFDENEAVMWFNPKWKELFGWIVPEGNKIYRIGLASSKNLAKNYKLFLEKLDININDKLDQQGGIIPYGVMKKVSFDNILLLGDAAGQVKATTGGGIVMLLTAAKYAALCIINCFKNEVFSKKVIEKYYEKPCLASIGKQLKIHFFIRIFLENLNADDFDTFFQIIKTSNIEKIVSLYGDMDFPRELVIRLMKDFVFIKFLVKVVKRNPLILVNIIKIFF